MGIGERVGRPAVGGLEGLAGRVIPVAMGIVALVAVVIVLVGPRVASLYEQERGGALLDEALRMEGYDTAEESWLLGWEALTEEEAVRLAEAAVERFRAAVAADPEHAQARRWLGRAALLLDEPLEAAEAFSAYVRRRPENPLAYWELGLAYERMAPGTKGAVHWAFEPRADLSDAVFAAGAVGATLEEAAVETPDVRIGTPHCDEGEGPASCFVATTTWWMPDAPGERLWTPEGEVGRRVLFMHPPAEATFTVRLPVTPTALAFWMGIDPAAHGWLGDGVVYEVEAEGREVFTHTLTPADARQGWHGGQVDLSAWAGEEVAVTLATDAGPAGDGQGDWAGWGDVRVVAGDGRVVPWSWVPAAWEEAGLTAQDLIAVGEEARKAERYEEALAWYERAAGVEPELRDPWYYAGLAYEGMEQWKRALKAYAQALASNRFGKVGESSPYYQMGVIYQWKLEPGETAQALNALERAIDAGAFRTTWEAADTHYRQGLILKQQGEEPLAYKVKFEQAVAIHPRHAGAHVLLGVSYYLLHEDVTMAEGEIEKALELNPQNRWAYLHLGDVYRKAGSCQEAKEAYRKALEIDSSFGAALERFEMPCEPR